MTPKNTYNTRCYHWDNSSEYIKTVIDSLHYLGVGLRLGMDITEHAERVQKSIQGQSVLAAFSGDTLVGGVSFPPILIPSPHYPGKCLYTGFMVVEPGHPGAALELIRSLRRIARDSGADWLIITRAVNDTDYLQKGWRIQHGHGPGILGMGSSGVS